ncbi:MAG: S16 family serine protease, partial [Candidatus Micrarchaeaceae archaeon]
ASVSVAVSVISAMEGMPVDQSVAMTGSLSVRGDVLPVGGITSKVEAAIDAGLKTVIVPKSNVADIYISKDKLKRIKVVAVKNIADVIENSIKKSARRDAMIKELRRYITTDYAERAPLIVSSDKNGKQ